MGTGSESWNDTQIRIIIDALIDAEPDTLDRAYDVAFAHVPWWWWVLKPLFMRLAVSVVRWVFEKMDD